MPSWLVISRTRIPSRTLTSSFRERPKYSATRKSKWWTHPANVAGHGTSGCDPTIERVSLGRVRGDAVDFDFSDTQIWTTRLVERSRRLSEDTEHLAESRSDL